MKTTIIIIIGNSNYHVPTYVLILLSMMVYVYDVSDIIVKFC